MQKNQLSKLIFHFSFFFLLSSFIFILSSCQRSTEPVFKIKNLHLKLLDVSCTEAWLSLKMEKAAKDSTGLQLQLYRDDSLMVNKPFSLTDSVLYVEGLQPSTSYSFTAKVLKNGQLQATSNRLSVTTMDTTSHDFEWQTFEFGGQGGSSYFKDVAIIDENDPSGGASRTGIWAVGEIYTADDKYNAAHWDGEKWELRKIKTNACGGVTYPPINTVFAFAKNDIVFGHIDASITKYNGATFVNDCSFIKQINGSINKIWGTSDKDLYVVGNNGLIAHYDGRQWTKIESGTEENINDIYGMKMGFNKYIYLAVGTVLSHTIPSVIKINSKNKATKINWPYKDRIPHSVWFDNPNLIYVAGGEIIRSNYLNSWQIVSNLPRIYLRRIRGISKNDIFVAGDFLILSHFNGLNWKLYESYKNGIYYSLDYNESTVVIIGDHEGKAIIKIGKR